MKRLTFVMMMVCALAPSTARANTGGFWDFIYGLDPKLTGFGADFHLTCHRPGGALIKHCEELFGLRPSPNPDDFNDLKHEFNIRLAWYFEYGESYSVGQLFNAANPFNAESMHAVKLMPMYAYHPDRRIALAIGAGWMPFWGSKLDSNKQEVPFNKFSKFIVTPLSLTYTPTTMNCGKECLWLKDFFLRGEATYIVHGVSPSDFDSSLPKIDRAGEWNLSFSLGYDFRRRTLGR